MRDKLGICQWFHYEDYESVERAVELLHELGVRHLRTGISWADYHRPHGQAWYDWQMRQLAQFDVLLSVWHTPPSISEGNCCNSPPRTLRDYADFLWQVNDEFGESFSHVELWNEPNNRLKWEFSRFDPQWKKFGDMIGMAARTVHLVGKPTVLGGMIPVDHHWLKLMDGYGALDDVDVVGIHAFPRMWWPGKPNWDWYSHWRGWRPKVDYIAEHCGGRPVWVTESGLATWHVEEERRARLDLQVEMLQLAAVAPVERMYWYCLVDLDPSREAIEGFHVDENEYHLGLVSWEGERKPAFEAFQRLLSEPAGAVECGSSSS